MAPDVIGRLARFQPWYLLLRARGQGVRAAFTLVGAFSAIVILGAAAMLADWPLLFPSLGPTAFVMFFRPSTPEASPRNVLFAHTLGVVCGWFALFVTGLTDAAPAALEGFTGMRVLAAGLSLAFIASLMVLLNCVHAPGASTTLIVALGLMSSPSQFLVIVIAAFALCVHAWVINRLCGVYYPVWECGNAAHRDGVVPRALALEKSENDGARAPDYTQLADKLVTSRQRPKG